MYKPPIHHIRSCHSLIKRTCLSLIDKCKSMKELQHVHTQLITSGLVINPYVAGTLVAFCALSDSGDIEYGRQILQQTNQPTSFAYNTLIRGYSDSRMPEAAFDIYRHMQTRDSSPPDDFTFTFLLKACTCFPSALPGEQLHSQITKAGFSAFLFVHNKLVHFYSVFGRISNAHHLVDEMPHPTLVAGNAMISGFSKSGSIDTARQVFDRMETRDIFSWNTIIAGYARNQRFGDVLEIFEAMQIGGPRPDHFTVCSVLRAIAHRGSFNQGKLVHQYIEENGINMDKNLGSSLVDMYSKCGHVELAFQVFDKLLERDVVTWNSMIVGLAMHGQGTRALEMFSCMRESGVEGDEVTYLGVLSACSHGGLVEEGRRVFEMMESRVVGVKPSAKHYGCMVDMLGRAGLLVEAENLINRMPVRPQLFVWGALLGGCKKVGNVVVGERAAKGWAELDPLNANVYVLLSNIYAGANRWGDAVRLREMVGKKGMKKAPAYSYIELGGVDAGVHSYLNESL